MLKYPFSTIEDGHEVWASGVTIKRSREAREPNQDQAMCKARVYTAQRPETIPKSRWLASR